MVTLLSSLLGFLSAAFPDMLKLFRDTQDRKHELEILKLQISREQQGFQNRLEEIQAHAMAAETTALYKTWHTGVRWVDALNGSVRPVLAYAFFLLYAAVKTAQISLLAAADGFTLAQVVVFAWGEEDQAIFAGIISFYYGQRAMCKARGKR